MYVYVVLQVSHLTKQFYNTCILNVSGHGNMIAANRKPVWTSSVITDEFPEKDSICIIVNVTWNCRHKTLLYYYKQVQTLLDLLFDKVHVLGVRGTNICSPIIELCFWK